MRIITLSLLLSLFSLAAFAQLPNGALAPDYSTITLDNDTFNLYNELNQHRPVIMDVSATWCGPCWNYHNGHALKNLYDQYGPDGTNEVRVIFVEGDGATNTNCLYGSSGCVGGTQGDWVNGTPYPIADDAVVSDQYAVNAFPTIMLVCPDKTVYEVGQVSTATLIGRARGCAIAKGTNNAAVTKISTGSGTEICESNTFSPNFKLQNLGLSPLTSATVEVSYNGTVIETVNWTGNLATYEAGPVAFASFTTDQIGKLSIRVVSANGGDDEDTTNDLASVDVVKAPDVTKPKLVAYIKTADQGRALYWECRKADGTVIEKGGNQAVGPDGGGQFTTPPTHPTAYANNATIQKTIVLPEAGCYYFHVVNGLGGGHAGGLFKIYEGSYSSFLPSAFVVGDFFESRDVHFGTSDAFVHIPELLADADLSIFPNPSSYMLTVSLDLKASAELGFRVVNNLGQTVHSIATATMTQGKQQILVPVQDLPNGQYTLQIVSEKGTMARAFSVQH